MTEKFLKLTDHEFCAHILATELFGMYVDKPILDVLKEETVCTIFRRTPVGFLRAVRVLFRMFFIEKEFKDRLLSINAIFFKNI